MSTLSALSSAPLMCSSDCREHWVKPCPNFCRNCATLLITRQIVRSELERSIFSRKEPKVGGHLFKVGGIEPGFGRTMPKFGRGKHALVEAGSSVVEVSKHVAESSRILSNRALHICRLEPEYGRTEQQLVGPSSTFVESRPNRVGPGLALRSRVCSNTRPRPLPSLDISGGSSLKHEGRPRPTRSLVSRMRRRSSEDVHVVVSRDC